MMAIEQDQRADPVGLERLEPSPQLQQVRDPCRRVIAERPQPISTRARLKPLRARSRLVACAALPLRLIPTGSRRRCAGTVSRYPRQGYSQWERSPNPSAVGCDESIGSRRVPAP